MLAKYAGHAALGVEITCLTVWSLYAVPRLVTRSAPREVESHTDDPAELSRRAAAAQAALDRRHLERPVKLDGIRTPKAPAPLTEAELDALGGPI